MTRATWRFRPEVEITQRALRASGGIVARVRSRGLPALEIGGGAARGNRRWLWSVARGEAYLETSRGGAIVRAGEIRVEAEGTARLLHTSADADLVVGHFDGVGAPSLDGRLDRGGRAAHAALLATLEVGDPQASARAVQRLGDVLGLPELGAAFYVAPPDPGHARVAEVVSRRSSRLAEFPAMVDFAEALGRPERRVSETLADYFRAYHASFSGWRSYLSTLRVELALGLLADPRHKTSDIATWLGYRGAPAMYHALARRGLSPDLLRQGV